MTWSLRPLSAAIFLGLAFASPLHAASITLKTTSCSNTVFDTFEETGDWTREVSGIGNAVCSSGSGVATGGTDGVTSSAVATAAGVSQSTPVQSTFGVSNFSVYEFMIHAPLTVTEKVQLEISALFTGSYKVSGLNSIVGGGTQAGAVVNANMYIGGVYSQVGADGTGYNSTSMTSPENSDTGTFSQMLVATSLVDVNTPFDVRLVASAFSSASANLQFTGTVAGSASTTNASLVFDGVRVLGAAGDYCVRSTDADIDTCLPDEPLSTVPLPASAVLLLAGLAGLGAVGRRRAG